MKWPILLPDPDDDGHTYGRATRYADQVEEMSLCQRVLREIQEKQLKENKA
jgi:hypothetical protein